MSFARVTKLVAVALVVALLIAAAHAASPSTVYLRAGSTKTTQEAITFTGISPVVDGTNSLFAIRSAADCSGANSATTTLGAITLTAGATQILTIITTAETGAATRYVCHDPDGAGAAGYQSIATIQIFSTASASPSSLPSGAASLTLTIIGSNLAAPSSAAFYLTTTDPGASSNVCNDTAASGTTVTFARASATTIVFTVATATGFTGASAQAVTTPAATEFCTAAAAATYYLCGSFQNSGAGSTNLISAVGIVAPSALQIAFTNPSVLSYNVANTITISDAAKSLNSCTRFKIIRPEQACDVDASASAATANTNNLAGSLGTVNTFTLGSFDASSCFDSSTGCNFFKISFTPQQPGSFRLCASRNNSAFALISGEQFVAGIQQAQGAPSSIASFGTAGTVRTAIASSTFPVAFPAIPRVLIGLTRYAGSTAVDTAVSCGSPSVTATGFSTTCTALRNASASNVQLAYFAFYAHTSKAYSFDGQRSLSNGAAWNSLATSKSSITNTSLSNVYAFGTAPSVAVALMGAATRRFGSTALDFRNDVFYGSIAATSLLNFTLRGAVSGNTRVDSISARYIAGPQAVDSKNTSGFVVLTGEGELTSVTTLNLTFANNRRLLQANFRAQQFIRGFDNTGSAGGTADVNVSAIVGYDTNASATDWEGVTITVAAIGNKVQVSYIALGTPAP